MRKTKLLFAILLISTIGITAPAAPKGQGKQKLGSSGTVVDENKGKQKLKASGTIVEDDTENNVVKAPPPPPPTMSRIAIATNAPLADVIVNAKRYKTDEKGVVRTAIDLRPGSATIQVKHPDFIEKSETVTLKQGQSIVQRIDLISKYGELKLGGIQIGRASC